MKNLIVLLLVISCLPVTAENIPVKKRKANENAVVLTSFSITMQCADNDTEIYLKDIINALQIEMLGNKADDEASVYLSPELHTDADDSQNAEYIE